MEPPAFGVPSGSNFEFGHYPQLRWGSFQTELFGVSSGPGFEFGHYRVMITPTEL